MAIRTKWVVRCWDERIRGEFYDLPTRYWRRSSAQRDADTMRIRSIGRGGYLHFDVVVAG